MVTTITFWNATWYKTGRPKLHLRPWNLSRGKASGSKILESGQFFGYPSLASKVEFKPMLFNCKVMGFVSAAGPWNWIGPGKR
jgi:hypothetical protein